jgi:hypothetical protein
LGFGGRISNDLISPCVDSIRGDGITGYMRHHNDRALPRVVGNSKIAFIIALFGQRLARNRGRTLSLLEAATFVAGFRQYFVCYRSPVIFFMWSPCIQATISSIATLNRDELIAYNGWKPVDENSLMGSQK